MTALWHYVFVILAFIIVEFHDETVAQSSFLHCITIVKILCVCVLLALCIRSKHDAFRLIKPLTYSLRLCQSRLFLGNRGIT